MQTTGHSVLRAVAVTASAALLMTALAVPVVAGEPKLVIQEGWAAICDDGRSLMIRASRVDQYLDRHPGAEEGVCLDGAAYLNDPALDGTYRSHGPVTLGFSSFNSRDVTCTFFTPGDGSGACTHDARATFVVVPDGNGMELGDDTRVLVSNQNVPWTSCQADGTWSQVQGAAAYPHLVFDLTWRTTTGAPVEWTIECHATD